jgi:hypothetical protein
MTSPSEKPLQLTVMTVECMNVENGILELLLNVQNNGTGQNKASPWYGERLRTSVAIERRDGVRIKSASDLRQG